VSPSEKRGDAQGSRPRGNSSSNSGPAGIRRRRRDGPAPAAKPAINALPAGGEIDSLIRALPARPPYENLYQSHYGGGRPCRTFAGCGPVSHGSRGRSVSERAPGCCERSSSSFRPVSWKSASGVVFGVQRAAWGPFISRERRGTQRHPIVRRDRVTRSTAPWSPMTPREPGKPVEALWRRGWPNGPEQAIETRAAVSTCRRRAFTCCGPPRHAQGAAVPPSGRPAPEAGWRGC
jgi:hypothetical protein